MTAPGRAFAASSRRARRAPAIRASATARPTPSATRGHTKLLSRMPASAWGSVPRPATTQRHEHEPAPGEGPQGPATHGAVVGGDQSTASMPIPASTARASTMGCTVRCQATPRRPVTSLMTDTTGEA